MVEALVRHRPDDSSFYQYPAAPTAKALLQVHELLIRAETDRIDVVHLLTAGPPAIAALLVAARLGLPVIASLPPPLVAEGPLRQVYTRALLRQIRRLLVTSMTARARFIRAGIDSGKIIAWRPGVDTSLFAPRKRSNELRERWGVSDTRPAVVYAGALSHNRGARLLRSMEVELYRTRPMHRLIVAGDGPAFRELRAACPKAFFIGAVPHGEMPRVLASADVYVCPNETDSTNLAVLEAQASGLPAVVMTRGSAHERVGDTSAVVCRDDADFIVETAALIRTDLRRGTMGVAAREHALRREWVPELMSIYGEYRTAAEISRLRRDLEPAFIPQGRHL